MIESASLKCLLMPFVKLHKHINILYLATDQHVTPGSILNRFSCATCVSKHCAGDLGSASVTFAQFSLKNHPYWVRRFAASLGLPTFLKNNTSETLGGGQGGRKVMGGRLGQAKWGALQSGPNLAGVQVPSK